MYFNLVEFLIILGKKHSCLFTYVYTVGPIPHSNFKLKTKTYSAKGFKILTLHFSITYSALLSFSNVVKIGLIGRGFLLSLRNIPINCDPIKKSNGY